ncbi:acetylornithine transaminase [Fictibacillus sp. KIGAM418]|uniref:Acetylornithine aminotransferase n=1 Tax=Fictibacillus marinisediminis TaxID=2878389 RepID=A0A9X1XFS9_9BACL|nr:acetylornithine transaminase [Fictibacillus marinisediminis]MCK6256724.1 acetylornithine transaminase [Fictibacillus marinisediminis]
MSALFSNYGRRDLQIESGSGSKLTDHAGKSYLDFTSGIGVCNLGHVHPAVTAAVENQLKKVWHTSNLFQSDLQEETAELLVKPTHLNKVFFCNSGAEANEAAIKLARKFTGKTKIITFEQSFHGRTYGAMAATGQDKIKKGFGPMLADFQTVPFNDFDSLIKYADSQTAAVMIEVVQGEGGVIPGNESFLQRVQHHCNDHDILLIIDEVQTGIGRTGKAFAFQHYGLKPDIVTSAKGLGNGFPVGAVLGTEEVSTAFGPGSHGTTFGGNPLAMAAASAVLKEVFSDVFLDEVMKKSAFLIEELQKELSPCTEVLEVRGLGLMAGIEFSHKAAPLIQELQNDGLLALPAGECVLRLLPPLNMSYEELAEGVKKISKAVKKKSILV